MFKNKVLTEIYGYKSNGDLEKLHIEVFDDNGFDLLAPWREDKPTTLSAATEHAQYNKEKGGFLQPVLEMSALKPSVNN
jgi:hypothetical protein